MMLNNNLTIVEEQHADDGSFFIELSNGLLIQGGNTLINQNKVNFYKEYSNLNYIIVTGMETTGNGVVYGSNIAYWNKTTSGFTHGSAGTMRWLSWGFV